jgi:hypothetical protein
MKAEILKATTVRGKPVEVGTVIDVTDADFVILRMQKQARQATETDNTKAIAKGKQGN